MLESILTACRKTVHMRESTGSKRRKQSAPDVRYAEPRRKMARTKHTSKKTHAFQRAAAKEAYRRAEQGAENSEHAKGASTSVAVLYQNQGASVRRVLATNLLLHGQSYAKATSASSSCTSVTAPSSPFAGDLGFDFCKRIKHHVFIRTPELMMFSVK